MQKLAAVASLEDGDFEKAEAMERQMIMDQPLYTYDNNKDNIIVEIDREFSKLCSVLEMKGLIIKGKTVLQFEAAIETLSQKPEGK